MAGFLPIPERLGQTRSCRLDSEKGFAEERKRRLRVLAYHPGADTQKITRFVVELASQNGLSMVLFSGAVSNLLIQLLLQQLDKGAHVAGNGCGDR